MNLVLVGLNHRTAPVAVREHYAVQGTLVAGLDEKLISSDPAILEAALVSTCNRTELIAVGLDPASVRDALVRFLHREIGDGAAEAQHVYELQERDAIAHVFEVASSLDSMVVGEAQILGQLKDAYREAVTAQSLGPLLNRLFQRAFRAAKRVRSETGLGASSVSVARVGVQLAEQVFESFEGKRVMLLGAGEMAEAALHGLRDAGVRDFALVNRTLQSAQQLALRFGGLARGLDELESELALADVVISSVQVDRPVLGAELLRSALARRQGLPTLIIDLGVPRNVDPAANALRNVYVFDIDDIEAAAERGRASRAAAIPAARSVVAREVDSYERWRAALPLVPTIRRLRARVLGEVAQELERDGSPEESEARERLAQAISARILHRPLQRLRREAEEGAGSYYAEAVRRLFALDEEETD
jgi:glutamyl-tRNA reductase